MSGGLSGELGADLGSTLSSGLTGVLWVAALGTGIIAGVYFCFSAFVMRALDELPPAEGIVAMRSINDVILSSVFMPLFFVTTLLSMGLAGYG